MFFKRFIAFFTAMALANCATAMSMQEVFDSVNAQGNVTNPGVLQGQTMNLYTGGSLFMRMPNRTYNLASVTPPSWNAGCGGIDMFMGGFSFINKEQFVAMLRNIGSNALGYSFKLAIQNLCPTCDNVMQALQATSQAINKMNVDSCETAKGLVHAAMPDTWTRGRQDAAKNFGVNSNVFDDITDAWSKVMNNERAANDTIQRVAAQDPSVKDSLPTGNIVWKALKKLQGIDDEERMLLMSMMGSIIFDTSKDNPQEAKVLNRKSEITVELLVGSQTLSSNISVPIWRCDTVASDGCLSPSEDFLTTASFKTMVRRKMNAISDKIAQRKAYEDPTGTFGFLNATDLPIYKMIAVTTSLNNTSLADALIGRYQDLIAAKYAELYIRSSVNALHAAISKYNATADAATSQAFKEMTPQIDQLMDDAKRTLSMAYSQTVSTYNIAQEVQYMERTLSSNLSQTLRQSVAFGKSLR